MAIKTIYQTLEDRGTDLDKLESNGPYICNWSNSWLGDGFYFWDTFIENAHWWGKEIRKYPQNYIVCKAICDYNDTECFDLVGSTEHLELLYETFEFLKRQGKATEKTTVARIIRYLKTDINIFNFKAIRAVGLKSKNFNSQYSVIMLFEIDKKPYLDIKPAIQICFFEKTSLNLRNYKIIYPAEYSGDYLV